MEPVNYQLPVKQYSHLELPLFLTGDKDEPVDLTGFEAHMQVRSPSGNLLLDLTTQNGGLVINPLVGSITIIIDGEQSSDPHLQGTMYDLVLIPYNGNSFCIMQGRVLFTKGQTHA